MYRHLLLNSVPFSLAAAFLIGGGAWRLRGTTLVPPALWALGSVVAVGGVEVLAAAGLIDADPVSPVRYAAAVTVLCPMMAVLGAKRPQDRAWQWVVVALLATLWLPAASSLLIRRDGSMHLSLAWQVFVFVLVLLGPLNYVPTRNWLPALVAAAGQGVVLAPFVAPAGWSAGEWAAPASLAAFFVAAGIVRLRAWRNDRSDARLQADALDELNTKWRRFRDAFGAFWAVRVMQRVNQGIATSEPPITLAWWGWEHRAEVADILCKQVRPEVAHARRTLRKALRRFVRKEE